MNFIVLKIIKKKLNNKAPRINLRLNKKIVILKLQAFKNSVH
jgi:hypothetical protein